MRYYKDPSGNIYIENAMGQLVPVQSLGVVSANLLQTSAIAAKEAVEQSQVAARLANQQTGDLTVNPATINAVVQSAKNVPMKYPDLKPSPCLNNCYKNAGITSNATITAEQYLNYLRCICGNCDLGSAKDAICKNLPHGVRKLST